MTILVIKSCDFDFFHGLKYQEKLFLFYLVAEYGDGTEFGAKKGIKGLSRSYGISHTYVNSLLIRLHEEGLIERRFGFKEVERGNTSRGRTHYRYKLTSRLLEGLKMSKTFFSGQFEPKAFKGLHQKYSHKYVGLLNGIGSLEKWVLLHVFVMSKDGFWEDDINFTRIKELTDRRRIYNGFSAALAKLVNIGFIAIVIPERTVCTQKKSPGLFLLPPPPPFKFNSSMTDTKEVDLFSPLPIKCFLNKVGLRSPGGLALYDKGFLVPSFLQTITPAQTAPAFIYGKEYHQFEQETGKQLSSLGSEVMMSIKISKIASIILSDHSELLLKGADSDHSYKTLSGAIFDDPNVMSQLVISDLIPETLNESLEPYVENDFAEAPAEILFLWQFTDKLINQLVYASYCLARSYVMVMQQAGCYEPTQCSYSIGYKPFRTSDLRQALKLKGMWMVGFVYGRGQGAHKGEDITYVITMDVPEKKEQGLTFRLHSFKGIKSDIQ